MSPSSSIARAGGGSRGGRLAPLDRARPKPLVGARAGDSPRGSRAGSGPRGGGTGARADGPLGGGPGAQVGRPRREARRAESLNARFAGDGTAYSPSERGRNRGTGYYNHGRDHRSNVWWNRRNYFGPVGALPYQYAYGAAPHYAWGFSPHSWGHRWRPTWFRPAWSFRGGYYGANRFFFGYGSRNFRFSLGFGHAYSPFFYSRVPHPLYRRFSYYPYSYYSPVAFYPAYSTVYHRSVVVDHYDVCDPYVTLDGSDSVIEEAVYAPESERRPATSALPVPTEFDRSFSRDVPLGLRYEDLVSRGQGWLEKGEILRSAEAFRKAWHLRPDDHLAPWNLAHALFASRGYSALGGRAVAEGLRRRPSWVDRPQDMARLFGGSFRLNRSTRALQSHLVNNPDDVDSRLLLAYVALAQDDAFTAFREATRLVDEGYDAPGLARLRRVAEVRAKGETPAPEGG